ncbi:major facilitator superfamily domain-containing protein [Xylariales sp. AK1849]|nr:major facilitator superfamily domain-containing protein [Xylariales sp. AK1849]
MMAHSSEASGGHVLTPEPEAYNSDHPDALGKADIERLGRQRPSVFPAASAEAGFVFTVIMSMMMSEYFISGFNIALPALAEDLDMPESLRTWPAAVPNLTTAACLLPCARLCDQYGGRIVFLLGHVWLVIWSVVAGFSQNSIMLIVCRAMQGIGSGAFLPAGIALLGQTYRPGPRKNLVFSLYGAMSPVGFYTGILIGGLAGQLLTWRWYFWIGAILVFINTTVGFLTIPTHRDHRDSNVRMDWWGAATIVPGLVLIVFALTDGGHAPQGWSTPYIYVTFLLGALMLCAAVYVEGWVVTQPLLPLDLFRPKYMRRLLVAMFCSYGNFGLFLFYASYHLETVLHTTPLQTAAWFTPLAVGGLFLALTGGLVLHLISGRILMIISGFGFLLSTLLFALIPDQPPSGELSSTFLYWAYVFPAMLGGTIGVDITYNVTTVFITTSMPSRLQATAGALINSVLYLGMAFWLGVGELAVSQTLEHKGDMSLSEQYLIGFWTGTALAGVSLCLVVTIRLKSAAADMTADEKVAAASNGTSLEPHRA